VTGCDSLHELGVVNSNLHMSATEIVLQARNMVAPRKRGVIGSMAAASDGPQQPVPDTVWVAATTGEDACTTRQALVERQPASRPRGVLLTSGCLYLGSSRLQSSSSLLSSTCNPGLVPVKCL
jgi:hypothetical protein